MIFITTTLSSPRGLSPFLAQILNSTYFLKASMTHSVPHSLSEGCPMAIAPRRRSKPTTTAPRSPEAVSQSRVLAARQRGCPWLWWLSAQIWSQLRSSNPHSMGLPLQILNNCWPCMKLVSTLSVIAQGS